MDHRDVAVEQAGAVEFAEDAHDAAGAMHVLDMHVRDRGRDLAQHRHAARQPVDVGHGEIDLGPRARRRADAARCWSSRPSRCRASSRSRTPRNWRCCAAARSRRPARNSGARDRRSDGPPRRTAARGRRGSPRSCRCRAATGPSASVRQFIELAVNMPEQEPQVGQAERSITATSASRDRARRRRRPSRRSGRPS